MVNIEQKKDNHMQEQVQEYFNNYFGETLNESTTDEEIMEAV